MSSEDLLPECRICGKRFRSAKAVHGHMRIHVLGHRECMEKESQELSPRRDVLPSTPLAGEKPSHECMVCRKNLPSLKSLHGHMRTHPDRTWRGVHPPAEGLFSGWSVTGKRGRLSSDSVSYGGRDLASTEIGSSMHKEADRVKDSGVKVEIKMPQDEKPPLDVPGIKAEETESKNSRISLSNDKPNLAIKRKARETVNCAPANNYTCSRCNKSFSMFQSLGGHRSSCNKSERSTTAYQASQTWSKLPWLDISRSLSPPNSSPHDLDQPQPQPRGQKTGFDLNVSLEMSPEDSDHMEQNQIEFP